MDNEYRIKSSQDGFLVLDPWGEYLVEIFPTEEAAKHAIAACVEEDRVWETAKILIDVAIQTLMTKHDLDGDTARRLMKDAMGG
jgi:hypothetical protein